MKVYNIGIIGYGGFGKFLHHWWDKMERVNVVAAADRSLNDGETAGLAQYTNWEDLIARHDIDIISIAVPPAFHVEIACAAMLAGKHVLLEKPIALGTEGAEQILQTQSETGMVVTVDHMLRYNAIVKAFIAFGQQETFGRLRHVAVSNYAQDESLPAEHWFWDKAISGGIFVEHGVHFFDIVNAFTKERVKEVCGSAHQRSSGQEDEVAAMIFYDQGLVASHYHSFSGPGFFEQTRLQLTYDLAKVEIEGWVPMKGRIKALVNAASEEKLFSLPGFRVESASPVDAIADVSRPEGWGDAPKDKGNIQFGGIGYSLQTMVFGNFEIFQTKSEVYGGCLQSILTDMIAKIENPGHNLNVTALDAYESLKIALMARG